MPWSPKPLSTILLIVLHLQTLLKSMTIHDMERMKGCRLVFLLALSATISVANYAQSPDSNVSHTIFLIGDAGEPYVKDDPIGKVLRTQILQAGKSATVLYLGDNIYPGGLADSESEIWQTGNLVLSTQVSWVKGSGAKGIFIPGNHDWNHWGKKGLQYIINQQHWIDSLKDKDIVFLPAEGCPGPIEVNINDNILLVILDTQWFLHQWEKPAEEGPCDARTTADVITALHDIFQRNYGKRIIVAGHHPLITYGDHGGIFNWKDHIFPLTDLKKNLYIPMPVIGSLYPLYRKFFGSIQDTPHPLYKEFSSPIQQLLREYPGNIYVAGHEHALQYVLKDSTHYIVSGSGAKVSDVEKKGYAKFAKGVRGFARLSFYANGKVSAEFFQVDENFPEGKEIFNTTFPPSSVSKQNGTSILLEPSLKSVRARASDQYHAGKWKRKLLGENYRSVWAQDIEVPVFDIGKERGGLKILQKGGGQQTLSLRLEDSTGLEYTLRSVEKYPEKAVPEMFRKTFAQDLVQDQISASHPYAALVIPQLAEAAGIYHTNPKVVFIPEDSRFKEYQKPFANTMALFEERPAGDWSHAPFFGHSKKIINTSKLLEELAKDNDNTVDQEFVLQSRLFDLLIGDWDRHDDQWRWATIDSKKGKLFRPIPRDRDQAFFVNEGKLAKIWSRKWALPKFEGFDGDIDWPAGLSFNARHFDRSFLTELGRSQWLSSVEILQGKITDEVIEKSIRQWPKEIFELRGNKIIKDLKSRRDKLKKYALEYYKFLSREVDVVGSDKRERFSIKRLENGNTHVEVFKITKEGEQGKKLYDRIFVKSETEEIRLYGLGGNDDFPISGSSSKAIRLRIIGGDGNDVIADSSRTAGFSKKIFFYDREGQFEITRNNEVKDKSSKDPSVNEYDRKAFEYNRFAPLIFGNYNPDDGLFVGGGFVHFVQGFRKEPFKQRHFFLASIAPLTQSFSFRYQGKFTEVISKWNFEIDADVKVPNYVNNFFGMGNETVFNKFISINYYRYRFEEIRLETKFSRTLGKSGNFKIGPAFQRIEMEEPEASKDRFIEQYAAGLDYNLFNEFTAYAGGVAELGIDKRNDPLFTRSGVLWNATGRTMAGLNKSAGNFSSLESALAIYYSFNKTSRVVFAARIGAGMNKGNYAFYQAQILDGKTEIRGFRKTRFYGDQKLYSNFEMRVKLLSFKSYLFPASFGIHGFHDLGRVWYKDPNNEDPSAGGTSHLWHKGWGGGVWFTPFNLTVLALELGHSNEGNLAYVRLGFLF